MLHDAVDNFAVLLQQVTRSKDLISNMVLLEDHMHRLSIKMSFHS
jgi:hypothetical protein